MFHTFKRFEVRWQESGSTLSIVYSLDWLGMLVRNVGKEQRCKILLGFLGPGVPLGWGGVLTSVSPSINVTYDVKFNSFTRDMVILVDVPVCADCACDVQYTVFTLQHSMIMMRKMMRRRR